MIYIDKTAIIKQPCLIGDDVFIGAYSIIGPEVKISKNNWIDSHVIINGKCIIGENNKFFKFAHIGGDPQSIKNINKNNSLIIGCNNVFREGSSIHKGTTTNNGTTIIGNNNYIMINSHIAHDCILSNNIILANNVSVAGHVKIGNFTNISGFVGVHQFVNIGDYSFIAASSVIYKDVFPFTIVSGNPAKLKKLNIVGLKRQKFDEKTILYLKKIYKLIFRTNITLNEIKIYLESENFFCKEKEIILKFLNSSKRGIIR